MYTCISRSLKTLKVRMEEHQKNSLIVGRWLEQHPGVVSVRHPGLPSHPQHELVKRQCYGHSGMMSFYLKGGLEESKKFLSSLKVSINRIKKAIFRIHLTHILVDNPR